MGGALGAACGLVHATSQAARGRGRSGLNLRDLAVGAVIPDLLQQHLGGSGGVRCEGEKVSTLVELVARVKRLTHHR